MTSYILTLAAFLLIGGSLGDRFGRRKVWDARSRGMHVLRPRGATADDQR
jgi:MFS family permease